MHNYLQLVRAALWGTPATWPVEQTDTLLRLNLQQGTGALVFPAVLAQEDIPLYARAQMKGVCMNTIQQHVHLGHMLRVAWSAMEKADIQVVLMKGAGLAVFYPEPQMRQWGDIDLFVGAQQYHPACAAMRATFPDALKFDEELDHYKHYNLIADGISIEIHRVTVSLSHPLDERRYARFEQYGMSHGERKVISGVEVTIPEPTFNALLIMLHSWEHMTTNGASVRQLCDFTLLIHHYAGQLDAPRLKQYLRALHLMDVWRLFMWIAVNQLGLPKDEALFYTDSVADRAQRLLTDLLAGKMVAPEATKPAPKGRLARKWHTMQVRMANARRMAMYSPSYGRHMAASIWLSGLGRLFAKDRHWE